MTHSLSGDLAGWLEQVPDYQRFLGVDELYAQARQAAHLYPELVRIREVGHSSAGEAIPMVSVGDGPVPLLFYACPHPNEPIGALLVSFLLDALTKHEHLRGRFTWHLLPCVDPDGTRLNEPWFAGPFTVRHYARHFYRPPGNEQVEWTFPVKHKRFVFDDPVPETRALMNALTQVRPAFVYALHNAGFGGVYYYLSRDLPAVYPAFYQVPESLGLVMATGEAETPWATVFAPAIFKTSGVGEAYDYYEQFTTHDPLEMLGTGGSSADFLATLGGPPALLLVTELPYFQAPAVADTTPTTQTRRELLLSGQRTSQALTAQVEALYAPIRPLMTLDSRLHRAFAVFHEYYLGQADAQRQAVLNDPETLKLATVAQRADALYVAQFYQLLIYGMLRRAIDLQYEVSGQPELLGAQAQLGPLLEAGLSDIEAHLEYSVVPIRKAVQTQLGALLAVLPHLHS